MPQRLGRIGPLVGIGRHHVHCQVIQEGPLLSARQLFVLFLELSQAALVRIGLVPFRVVVDASVVFLVPVLVVLVHVLARVVPAVVLLKVLPAPAAAALGQSPQQLADCVHIVRVYRGVNGRRIVPGFRRKESLRGIVVVHTDPAGHVHFRHVPVKERDALAVPEIVRVVQVPMHHVPRVGKLHCLQEGPDQFADFRYGFRALARFRVEALHDQERDAPGLQETAGPVSVDAHFFQMSGIPKRIGRGPDRKMNDRNVGNARGLEQLGKDVHLHVRVHHISVGIDLGNDCFGMDVVVMAVFVFVVLLLKGWRMPQRSKRVGDPSLSLQLAELEGIAVAEANHAVVGEVCICVCIAVVVFVVVCQFQIGIKGTGTTRRVVLCVAVAVIVIAAVLVFGDLRSSTRAETSERRQRLLAAEGAVEEDHHEESVEVTQSGGAVQAHATLVAVLVVDVCVGWCIGSCIAS
mmetsp:Transcript_19378/g.44955  ORF Transcript_19378/g.44955 Transcript_19378/m.44955 type:complete len:463 (+) Transcript_19378:318-1706(+)